MIDIQNKSHFEQLISREKLEPTRNSFKDYSIYSFNLPFTKSSLVKETNGITFSEHSGRVMARPNSYIQNINCAFYLNLSEDHWFIRDKGEMIFAPFFRRWQSSRFCTPMGPHFEVECFVSDNPKFFKICKALHDKDMSPTFRWTSTNLQLFIIRELNSGKLVSYNETEAWAKEYQIATVSRWKEKIFEEPALMLFESGRMLRGSPEI